MDSPSPARQDPSFAGFLDLPPELRVIPTSNYLSLKACRIRYTKLLPLLLANAQITEEISAMFFGQHGIHLIPYLIDSRDNSTAFELARWVLLPRLNFRPLIKHAKITLRPPRRIDFAKHEMGTVILSKKTGQRYELATKDWFSPMNEAARLGFWFESVVFDVRYKRDTYAEFEEQKNLDMLMRKSDRVKKWLEAAVREIAKDTAGTANIRVELHEA